MKNAEGREYAESCLTEACWYKGIRNTEPRRFVEFLRKGGGKRRTENGEREQRKWREKNFVMLQMETDEQKS